MDILTGIFLEGLIFGIMALGVYISYKVLDFADLSVDGTFPLGAAVSAAMIAHGMNPSYKPKNGIFRLCVFASRGYVIGLC